MDLLEEIKEAKKHLLSHGVVAFPTETVMGLGVIYNDFEAYNKLNRVKERPEDKPYTLMLKNKEEMKKYAIIDEATQRVIDRFVPGSITVLVRVKDDCVPSYVTHGTNIIGMRVPTNEEALALLNEVNLPLLVPSANKSGQKPAKDSHEVKDIFGNEVDFVISGKAKSGNPSTIVDLSNGSVKVVREGPISKEEIERVYYNK